MRPLEEFDQAIRNVGRAAAQLEKSERQLRSSVALARAQNVPWSTIAEQLGITRQSAHQRFRDLDPDRGDDPDKQSGHGTLFAVR